MRCFCSVSFEASECIFVQLPGDHAILTALFVRVHLAGWRGRSLRLCRCVFTGHVGVRRCFCGAQQQRRLATPGLIGGIFGWLFCKAWALAFRSDNFYYSFSLARPCSGVSVVRFWWNASVDIVHKQSGRTIYKKKKNNNSRCFYLCFSLHKVLSVFPLLRHYKLKMHWLLIIKNIDHTKSRKTTGGWFSSHLRLKKS